MHTSLDGPFSKKQGHAWAYTLPEHLALLSDNPFDGERSPIRLFEDGRELGPPHTLHHPIGEYGCGRYSLWRGSLLFSTSDNSDPNKNGRKYELRIVSRPTIAPSGRCKHVVYVLGASYSGSTLLSLMMGSHSQMFGGGELHWLTSYKHKKNYAYACAVCQQKCIHWTQDFIEQIPYVGFYDAISERFNKPIIVDSSKRTSFLRWMTGLNVRHGLVPILIVKHPVRHVASLLEKMRKPSDRSFKFSINTIDEALWKLYDYYSDIKYFSPRVVVQYEKLVTQPKETLEPILSLMGVSYEPTMIRPFEYEHHHVGGNEGPVIQLTNRAARNEFVQKKYNKRGIFLDNSYQDILTNTEIDKIMNHPLAQKIIELFNIEDETFS